MSDTFEDGTTHDCAKLVSIHSQEIINVIEKIANFFTHVRDKQPIITMSINETHGVDDGIMKRLTCVPNTEKYEMIYSGPHFHVANPYYKTPRQSCVLNSDYDNIDLTEINADYVPRTNYVPVMPLKEYKELFKGFQKGQDKDGKPIYDNWMDYYKVGFRNMLSIEGERSLICAVLRSKTAHINGVISTTFSSGNDTVDMAAICSSVVLDFYIKTIGSSNLLPKRLSSLPLGTPVKYQSAMYSRALMLNCLTAEYADLWESCWRDDYINEKWSIEDNRLKSFSILTEKWTADIPLRNYFERRQALVEIDVLAAMALGLSLQDLEMIYTIQFPVLQQNENDTWYDAEGKIVFTCSKGLTGVGLDRPAWNAMRGNPITDADGTVIAYKGAEPQYIHTIDPRKSELYGGQQQTFIAPYNRCDRIADYRTAWAHFEKIFNQK